MLRLFPSPYRTGFSFLGVGGRGRGSKLGGGEGWLFFCCCYLRTAWGGDGVGGEVRFPWRGTGIRVRFTYDRIIREWDGRVVYDVSLWWRDVRRGGSVGGSRLGVWLTATMRIGGAERFAAMADFMSLFNSTRGRLTASIKTDLEAMSHLAFADVSFGSYLSRAML